MRTQTAQLLYVVIAIALSAAPSAVHAQEDFFDLSLEQLSQVKVTTVSRKPEEALKAASAVYVLTAEDIRRSGATTIPEVLRLVPGLQVARLDSKRWAVSSRGFNNAFAMKLLVLIDGRTVYSPLYSGVEWDAQDVMMDEIERIEVVRGPGASIWGANAVNGVINIITKSSNDTQGGHAYAGSGSEEEAIAGFRYGSKLGEATAYRVSGKYFNRDQFELQSGGPAEDGWRGLHGALRVDSELNEQDRITVQGDAVSVREGQAYEFDPVASLFEPLHTVRAKAEGSSVTGRWTRELADESELQLQGYYAYEGRYDRIDSLAINTFDLDFQHRFPLLGWNDIVWGLGYRQYQDSVRGTVELAFEPSDRSLDLFTGFVQDEITLVEDYLRVIAGTKLEHNGLTGWEVQPTVRLAWTPDERQTVWAAASRAVRTPSRVEHDGRLFFGGAEQTPLGVPAAVFVFGDRDADAENLSAYELGYRNQISESFYVDIAAHFNRYTDQLSVELQDSVRQSEPVEHLLVPLRAANKLAFNSHGVEVSANWQAARSWRLTGSYWYINIEYDDSSTSNLEFLRIFTREAPAHQFNVRSLWNVTEKTDFDLVLRFVDNIAVGRYDDVLSDQPRLIPEYAELDLRLAWRPTANWEFSAIGQNLLHAEHVEWAQGLFGQTLVSPERGAYFEASYKF